MPEVPTTRNGCLCEKSFFFFFFFHSTGIKKNGYYRKLFPFPHQKKKLGEIQMVEERDGDGGTDVRILKLKIPFWKESDAL